MANQRNSLHSVPLNGDLNYSKLKTKVTDYNGFNDCNSPIYGDTITPFWKKSVDQSEIKSDKPYIEDGYLKDTKGKILMDVSDYRGVKRETLSMPDGTIAFYDETHYITKVDGVTTLHSSTNSLEITDKVNSSTYTKVEEGAYIIFVVMPTELRAYDSDTLELKSNKVLDKSYGGITTFYNETYGDILVSLYDNRYEEKLTDVCLVKAVYEEDEILRPPQLQDRGDLIGVKYDLISYGSRVRLSETMFSKHSVYDSKVIVFTNENGFIDVDICSDNKIADPANNTSATYIRNYGGYLAGDLGEDTYSLGMTTADVNIITQRRYFYVGSESSSNIYTTPRNEAKIEYEFKYKGNGVFEPVKSIEGAYDFTESGTISTVFTSSYKGIAQTGLRIDIGSGTNILTLGVSGRDTSEESTETGDVSQMMQTSTPSGAYFRKIINAGVIQSISVAPGENKVGSLCENIGSLDSDAEITVIGNTCSYKMDQGEWRVLTITDNIDSSYLTFVDDYVIIQTVEQQNCINLKSKRVYHFSSDWNNRWTTTDNGNPGLSLVGIPKPIIGSGINARFETSDSAVIGFLPPFKTITGNTTIYPIASESELDQIEVYVGSLGAGEVVPKYKTTLSNGTYFSDTRLEGLVYPDTINIPSLFSEYIESAFNQVFVKDGTESFSLIVYDTKLYFGYYSSTYLDNIKNIFTIQGQTFAVTTSGHIYSVQVIDGVYYLDSAIVDIEGLLFCGCVPDMAVFFSPMDRTLKSFTADKNLKNLAQATNIGYIYYVKYNPQTFAIYIATDNGLYVMSQFNQYRLPLYNISSINFEGKHIYIGHDGEVEDYLYEYETGCEKVPVHIETKYYGAGNNIITDTDCVYFRLFNEHPGTCFLKIKSNTITDGLYRSEWKEIDIPKEAWDEDTNTCFVRYQPQYQRAAGISLTIDTDSAISEITFGSSEGKTVASSRAGLDI